MNYSMKTDIGKVRSSNQDAMTAWEPEEGRLFAIVCDGMGGANGGNVASELCIKTVRKQIESGYYSEIDDRNVQQLMQTAIYNANVLIHNKAAGDESLHGMGTTVVLAYLNGSDLCLAHVGDSRAMLVRNHKLHRLSKDHSVVQSMIDSGEITEEEAESHPQKHIITRSVGVSSVVEIDITQVAVQSGDLLLLCSDGLTNHVSAEDIVQAADTVAPELLAEELVQRANDHGGTDNITVIAVLICV